MAKAKNDGWGDLLIGHVIAFVACVAFPGFVTAIAPVSWIYFERHGDKVTARTHTCLFFVIPYSSKTVDPVVGIGDRFVRGTVSRSRSSNSRTTRSEDEGFLVIQGIDKKVEVSVTPFNIDRVAERAHEFLEDPQSTQLRMTVVANWKFSVFVGGLISLLTVIYVLGMTFSIFRWLLRLVGFLNDNEAASSSPTALDIPRL